MSDPLDAARRALTAGALTLVGETLAMVRFYSRLPIPSFGRFDDPARPPGFGAACRMLPVASLVIGLPMALVAALLAETRLPTLVAATIALAVALLTTGALHEDGLADVADGFGGGATKERKLEIMKDSRVGSYGVAALALALLARAGLIAEVIGQGAAATVLGLLAAAVVSRTASLGLFAVLPPARASGVASTVGQPTQGPLAVAIALALGLAAALAVAAFGPLAWVVACGAAAIVTLGFARLATAQIGGQTGDVVGAAQVIAEIAFLAGLLAVRAS